MNSDNSTLKWAILLILVIQTSLTVLLFRYSLTTSTTPYIGTTVVLATECVKYIMSLFLLLCQQRFSFGLAAEIYCAEIIGKPRQTVLLCVPALLYTLQNNILIVALKNLDAATFQVTYQLKILTTAAFSVVLLHKELVPRQWFSLVLLTIGVALVQIPSSSTTAAAASIEQNRATGLVAVLVACFSSGFAGVYYEKLLKTSSQPSLIIRNLQLGIFAVFLAVLAMLCSDSEKILIQGMFQGYTWTVWTVILLQSVGGLVVAATIKYADNILKGFATSLSILVSGTISWLLLGDLQPGQYFVCGTLLVLCSSALYSHVPRPKEELPT